MVSKAGTGASGPAPEGLISPTTQALEGSYAKDNWCQRGFLGLPSVLKP